MSWDEIREIHAHRWLVIEALAAHSEGDRRVLDRIEVVDECDDASSAFRRHRRLRAADPGRELYFVHTADPDLAIVLDHPGAL
jgi:hypothetical protein